MFNDAASDAISAAVWVACNLLVVTQGYRTCRRLMPVAGLSMSILLTVLFWWAFVTLITMWLGAVGVVTFPHLVMGTVVVLLIVCALSRVTGLPSGRPRAHNLIGSHIGTSGHPDSVRA